MVQGISDMEDAQFEKLMAVNLETQSIQRQQDETLTGVTNELQRQGETLNGLKQENEKQSETLNGLGIDLAKMETNVGNLKERASEDRKEDSRRNDRLEAKLTKVHERVNDVPKLRGEFENHAADDHATKAAEAATAIEAHVGDEHAQTATETKAKLEKHMDDNNRHGGEAPGGEGMSTGAKVGYGAGGSGVIALIIYEVVKLIQG